jgi:hypothetical protein
MRKFSGKSRLPKEDSQSFISEKPGIHIIRKDRIDGIKKGI